MLALLTDAHISPEVARQVREKRPEIVIYSLREWREGVFLEAEDDVILMAARGEGLTFVTYDQRTIGPLVMRWGAEGRDHTGVVFINRQTIAQSDIGSQVRGLLALWEANMSKDWTNITLYLKLEPRVAATKEF